MTPTFQWAITASGLSKRYGPKTVLDNIDLQVPAGTVFSLLGPNGAGKTTVVHILSTYLHPDAGEVRVAGHDLRRHPEAVRRAIGVTGQFSAVDGLLTAEQNLHLMGDLLGLGREAGRRRAAELLERFELSGAATQLPSTYSGGMRRRLDLAMTLMGDPQLIFLDEPTTGLDPRSRQTMWRIVRELVAGGVTIFLTTQYLDEADELSDRIAVLHGGRIVAEGSPAELKRLVPGGHIRLEFTDRAALERAAGVLDGAVRDADALTLRISGGGEVHSLRTVLDSLERAGVDVEALSVHTPDLDDVFFALTGQPTAQTPEARA